MGTIGVVGDLHLRENLGYADYITDRRILEKKEVLDFIHESFNNCDAIVLMGDNFNAKNNPSNIIKEFVAFVKGFGDKKIYILAGNHEKFGNGKSAIDFMKEMKNPNWHIITNTIEAIKTDYGNLIFCPYFSKAELNIADNQQASRELEERIVNNQPNKKNILFVHHTISDTKVTPVALTNLFNEVVLDKNKLLESFELIVGGHIHTLTEEKGVVITGSVFNNEVGELGKKIWEVDSKTKSVKSIELPGRKIYKKKDPTITDLKLIEKNSIVKVIVMKRIGDKLLDELKEYSRKTFDAFVFLEQYPSERKKIHFEDGMLEFTPDSLLKIYAKQRKVDIEKLKSAYKLIIN